MALLLVFRVALASNAGAHGQHWTLNSVRIWRTPQLRGANILHRQAFHVYFGHIPAPVATLSILTSWGHVVVLVLLSTLTEVRRTEALEVSG